MERTLDFVEAVRRAGTPMWVRHVVVPGSPIKRSIWLPCGGMWTPSPMCRG